jgi:hypothetical protein
MAAKQRTPKGRGPTISPEALALFRKGLSLQHRGAEAMAADTLEWLHPRLNEQLATVKNELRGELGLEFSDMSPFDDEAADPKPPKFGWHRCWTQSWPKIRALRVMLEEALRESRSRKKPAGAADGTRPA